MARALLTLTFGWLALLVALAIGPTLPALGGALLAAALLVQAAEIRRETEGA